MKQQMKNKLWRKSHSFPIFRSQFSLTFPSQTTRFLGVKIPKMALPIILLLSFVQQGGADGAAGLKTAISGWSELSSCGWVKRVKGLRHVTVYGLSSVGRSGEQAPQAVCLRPAHTRTPTYTHRRICTYTHTCDNYENAIARAEKLKLVAQLFD